MSSICRLGSAGVLVFFCATIGCDDSRTTLLDSGTDADITIDLGIDAAKDFGTDDGSVDVGPVDSAVAPPDFLPGNSAEKFTHVSSRSFHGCGLRVDGSVSCWGSNNAGQSEFPPGQYSTVESGYQYTCGLRKNTGEAVCVGSAGIVVPKGISFDEISVGGAPVGGVGPFACGIEKTGSLRCWGYIDAGAGLEIPTGKFVQLSAGAWGACAVKADDGNLACWSSRGGPFYSLPKGPFKKVAVGVGYACAIRTDETLACWGDLDDKLMFKAPTEGGLSDVGVGDSHACALKNGKIKCWGVNLDGQLDAPTDDFVRLSVGRHHTCALMTDGSLRCWGRVRHPLRKYESLSGGIEHRVCGVHSDGAISCSGEGPETFPWYAVPIISDPVQQLAMTDGLSCAIVVGGSLKCWNDIGGIGPVPTGTYQKVVAFRDFGCAIRQGGALQCWKDLKDDAPSGTFVDVAVSEKFDHGGVACGVRTDGTVVCWQGSTRDDFGFLLVPDGKFKKAQISDSGPDACALRENGTVACWGKPESIVGQPVTPLLDIAGLGGYFCGILQTGKITCWGDRRDSSRPASMPPSNIQFTKIWGPANWYGGSHMCGLDVDGRAWCWGDFVVDPTVP